MEGARYRDHEWLREKYDQGMCAGDIAEECGVHRVTIYKWARRAGIDTMRPNRRPTPKRDLIDDIRRVADLVGKEPSRAEYEVHGEHSPDTVSRRFGTWVDGKREALE